MLTSTYTYQFKYAISNDIPFSVKAGGLSNKNSVEGGLVINLSGFHGVTVNASKNTVTLQSGVTGSQLVDACFREGFCVGDKLSSHFLHILDILCNTIVLTLIPSRRWRSW